MMRRRGSDESGFSLLETLAAITVFALLTVGLTPLLVSSLRGSALSRQYNFAKSLVQEAMERVRGLPYYDSRTGRDVLDLYYPNLTTPAYSGGTFTTTCTSTSQAPAPSAVKACPPNRLDGPSRLPAGYTVTFAAQFVTPSGTGSETFTTVVPTASTYDSLVLSKSTPPSQLLRMTVTATWTQIGRPRSFTLTSLIGSRKTSTDTVRGLASVDFTVQSLTGFTVSGPTRLSNLTAEAGRSVSEIEIRAFPGASTENMAARIQLQRQEYNELSGETVPGQTIGSALGATATARAPATITPTVVGGGQPITHPDIFPEQQVGQIVEETSVNVAAPPAPALAPSAAIVAGLPQAAGNFTMATGGPAEHMWINNQADTSNTAVRKLDPLRHVLSLFRLGGNDVIRGSTSAIATDIASSDRKVESIAFARLPKLELLPSTVTLGQLSSACSGCRGIVVIQNFQAQVNCKATGSASTSTATATWSATLYYWTDPAGIAVGRYEAVELSGSTTPADNIDPLAAIRTQNPLVIEGALSVDDVYLFEDTSTNKTGFLKEWRSTRTVSRTVGVLGTGSEARVDLPFAINMVTAKTNDLNEETRLTVNIGKLNCQAVDQR